MKPALVFDLDDTLFPEHQFVLSGFGAVDSWLRRERGLRGFAEMAAGLFHDGLRGRVFNDALEQLGMAADEDLIAQLVTVYRGHDPVLSLHDDARWALARFRKTHRLGLLTDGYLATQRRKLWALRIESIFDAIVYSDEFGRECWKPSPVPYRAIMRRLDCDGTSCTYVSDNPTKDFLAANELGWTTVQIRRPDGEYRQAVGNAGYRARFEIDSLHGLERVVTFVAV